MAGVEHIRLSPLLFLVPWDVLNQHSHIPHLANHLQEHRPIYLPQQL